MDTAYLKENLVGFVPQEVSYEIIGKVVRGSSILRLSKVETMQSDAKKFSVFKNGVGAYWVEEGGSIGTGAPQWEFPIIRVKKLAVTVPVTREKLDDSVINVMAEVQNVIAEAFYKEIDNACLFGVNSPFSSSIYTAAAVSGMDVAEGANAKLDLDISDIMAKVEAKGYDATGFIANIAFKNRLRKLRDANGTPLYTQGLLDQNGIRYDTLYGLPIEFCRNGAWDEAKALCICGNWDYSVVGMREEIRYEILKEATLTTITMADGKPLNLAERDMVAIKATMRLGFLPVRADAFSLLTPAGTVLDTDTLVTEVDP